MTMSPGDWVKWRRNGGGPHLAKGRIVSIGGRVAIVRPESRHRQDVVMETCKLKPWKSRNAIGAR